MTVPVRDMTVLEGQGKFGRGRAIRGWAFAIIDSSLNYDPDLPRTRMDEVVERFDDSCKVGDTPLIGRSSLSPDGSPYVVWITDVQARRVARGEEPGEPRWAVSYRSKSSIFGGGGSYDTLDKAVASFDEYRGKRAETLTLF